MVDSLMSDQVLGSRQGVGGTAHSNIAHRAKVLQTLLPYPTAGHGVAPG